MHRILLLGVSALLIFSSCKTIPTGSSPQPPSHAPYTALLQEFVNDSGWVNYDGLLRERSRLDAYLQSLSANPPAPQWSSDEREAYWINAYNAFTLQLILDHYPVGSIKDIGPAIQIPFINTPWQKKFFSIGGDRMDLDEIEHHILRKEFEDARIHFALVCASRSCAKLRREAYTGARLDEQLNDQARTFLANRNKNIITPDRVQVSKYFKWFKKDFKRRGTVIEYLNQFAPVQILPDAEIDYLEYNWNLNKQSGS